MIWNFFIRVNIIEVKKLESGVRLVVQISLKIYFLVLEDVIMIEENRLVNGLSSSMIFKSFYLVNIEKVKKLGNGISNNGTVMDYKMICKNWIIIILAVVEHMIIQV